MPLVAICEICGLNQTLEGWQSDDSVEEIIDDNGGMITNDTDIMCPGCVK